ncbi:M48 family metalloprotease [Peptococcaceae bacterium]|nr:M48 family metalloprotease [Peptococcaceae bacterium]
MEGILAHELARIKHRDVQTNIIVTLLSYFTAIFPIFWCIEVIVFPDLVHIVPDWTIGMVLIVAGVAFYLMPGILKAAERRNSKYQFDAAAVQMAGNSERLISALLKLEQSAFVHRDKNNKEYRTVKLVYFKAYDLSGNIANPPPGSILGKLFGTHPPITDRVQQLKKHVEQRAS